MTNTLTTFQTINNTPMMSSRQLATVLGSTHREVLRGIRNMAEELEIDYSDKSQIIFDEYRDSMNRRQPMIWINEQLTLVYGTGFSLKMRNKLIKELLSSRKALQQVREAENIAEVKDIVLTLNISIGDLSSTEHTITIK